MNLFKVKSFVGLFALLLFLGAFSFRSLADEKASGDSTGESPHSPIGLEGVELSEWESDFEPPIERFVLPPYYQEIAGPLTTRFFFPLYFFRQREGKDAKSDLGILPFYWRHRSSKENADVYFPLYWRFRGSDFKTDIALQTYYNRSGHGYNFGFGPLFFWRASIMIGEKGRILIAGYLRCSLPDERDSKRTLSRSHRFSGGLPMKSRTRQKMFFRRFSIILVNMA